MSLPLRQQKLRDLAKRIDALAIEDRDQLLNFIIGYCDRTAPPKIIEALEAALEYQRRKTPAQRSTLNSQP